jgi:hypothetical protein
MTPAANDSNALYQHRVIHHKVCIPFSEIREFRDISDRLTQHVSNQMSGKCIAEGFVKPNTCHIISHSVGTFAAGNIVFHLEVGCMLCCPKEGAIMNCVAKTVTQAGIRAHAFTKEKEQESSPVVIYISREMHDSSAASQSRTMDSIRPGDMLAIRVVGRRFELNDKHVSIIGEWISI